MEHKQALENQVKLRRQANRLLIENLKNGYSVNDSPEQSLVRKTLEHPEYSLHYSFQPYSYKEDWFVSDVGMNMSSLNVMMNSSEMMIAVDCEMVLCDDGTEACVRVGAVDRDLTVILDEFVKPEKRIVDYRTVITGVTPEDISKATYSVADIQKVLQPFLSEGAILVGHSLNKDLAVLKINHPRVIDTSLVFKFNNARNSGKPSLNNLCLSILGYGIQKVGVPHHPLHDAEAAMKLVLAFFEKRFDTTISPSAQMVEAEKSRLFVHRIPHYVSSEKLNHVLSGNFTVDVKPSKTQGGYYCAVLVFENSKEADQSFKNARGNLEKDSYGFPQKSVVFEWTSGLSIVLYVRKMVKD